MSLSSPGQRSFLWTASLPNNDIPIEAFLRSGIHSVPVALVPTNGGYIRVKNPKVTQEELRKATPHFQSITDVRQFGRGGILCCSPDQTCVSDLLQCQMFANHPVRPFIPPHLACVKGLVRGVDASLCASEVLEMFSPAGAVSVYRCSRVSDNQRVPTESVIVTFAGTTRPSEIKAWPLLYRVEALSPRPVQCVQCWRYGHSIKGCRSDVRCRICGEGHDGKTCSSQSERCCLCEGSHPADCTKCPARDQELEIMQIIERKRCSRREAHALALEKSCGYAEAAARHSKAMDASLGDVVAAAVEKAMAKALDSLFTNLSETIGQVFTSQLSQLLHVTAHPNVPSGIAVSDENIKKHQSAEASPRSTDDTAAPATPVEPEGFNSHETGSDTTENMDLDARTCKRRASPNSPRATTLHKLKAKKSQNDRLTKDDFLKDNILQTAVNTAGISST